ncbi:MAG: hypothetical protein AAF614_30310 [Chloroflexota bacterium]
MHTYTTYGLRITSQLELPEFLPSQATEPIDVTIRMGKVPLSLPSPKGKGILYEANEQQFLLKIDHIARYFVQAGNSITIDPRPEALSSDIRVFLLGSCLGALLHQRGIFALHASAINTTHGAVLFTGPSGIGKSTLLNAFLQQGYKMLADDIAAIFIAKDQTPMIMPAFPRTKLWEDSAQALQIDTATLARTRPKLKKFEHYVPQQFEPNPQPIHRIYHLNTRNGASLSLEPIPKMRTVQTLVLNTYRHQFLDGLAMRDTHFQLLTKVAQHIPIMRVTRPRVPLQLDGLVDMLLTDIHA